MASAQSQKMLQWYSRSKLRPQIPEPPLCGFFIARPVRAFSHLEPRVRKVRLDLVMAVIVLITEIVKLISKLV